MATAGCTVARQLHIQLVGCNGIPSAVYEPLLRRLRQRYNVCSTSIVEVFPKVGSDWSASVDLVAESAERSARETGRPVIGLGHSLGGALTWAAAARCEAFDSVLLWDPPMFRPKQRLAMAFLQRLRLMRHHPLVRTALKRPPSFPSRQLAEDWCQGRRLYRSFHPDMLEALLSDGLVELDAEDGSTGFRFSAREEAEYFCSTPADLAAFLPGVLAGLLDPQLFIGQYAPARVRRGVCFVSTDSSDSVTRDSAEYLREQLVCSNERPADFVSVPGTHFYPLQDPDGAAAIIAQAIRP